MYRVGINKGYCSEICALLDKIVVWSIFGQTSLRWYSREYLISVKFNRNGPHKILSSNAHISEQYPLFMPTLYRVGQNKGGGEFEKVKNRKKVEKKVSFGKTNFVNRLQIWIVIENDTSFVQIGSVNHIMVKNVFFRPQKASILPKNKINFMKTAPQSDLLLSALQMRCRNRRARWLPHD